MIYSNVIFPIIFQEALDLLREYWSLCHQTVTDERRALAFARAAAAVKCLPFKVTNPRQVKKLEISNILASRILISDSD